MTFLLASGLVIVVPGPATLYVSHRALQSNTLAALAVLGIVTGDVVLIAAASLGFATLLAQWPLLLQIGKLVGASYLVYVAIGMLRPASGKVESDGRLNGHARDNGRGSGHDLRQGSGFRQALLVTLTNPKPILFFAAFFPGFIDPAVQTPLPSFAMLGLMFEGLNLLYFATLIAILGRLRSVAMQWVLHGGMVQKVSAVGLLLCSVLTLLM